MKKYTSKKENVQCLYTLTSHVYLLNGKFISIYLNLLVSDIERNGKKEIVLVVRVGKRKFRWVPKQYWSTTPNKS